MYYSAALLSRTAHDNTVLQSWTALQSWSALSVSIAVLLCCTRQHWARFLHNIVLHYYPAQHSLAPQSCEEQDRTAQQHWCTEILNRTMKQCITLRSCHAACTALQSCALKSCTKQGSTALRSGAAIQHSTTLQYCAAPQSTVIRWNSARQTHHRSTTVKANDKSYRKSGWQ